MLSNLAVLGLYAFASSMSVDDVNPVFEGGRLVVDIATSEPVELKETWTKLARGKLHIYFMGAKVHSDRRRFSYADRTVEVLPRTDYAKVEVPWGEGISCAGTVRLEATDRGARASVGCHKDLPPAAVAPPIAAASASAATLTAVSPPVPSAPAPARAPAPGPAPTAPPLAAAPVAPAPVAAASHSSPSFVLPGLLLVGVAAGAVILGRRRAKRPGLIQIMETASLGPKRALVIAKVNGQVMLLGSSEAGITFLGAPRGAAGSAAAVAPASVEFAPVEVVDAPLDERGLLSRLFGRRQVEPESEPDMELEETPMDWKDFDDLLAESREDQELRRKLAAGLGAKVS